MVYLDNSSTTNIPDQVTEKIADILAHNFGNPSSLHSLGTKAIIEMDSARANIADSIKARPDEVFFTGSATEANNIALLGAAGKMRRRGNKIITTSTEHLSVLLPLKYLSLNGFEVIFIDPDIKGQTDIHKLIDHIDDKAILISSMSVNNETGEIRDIAKLAALSKEKKPDILVHCDYVQSYLKTLTNVNELGVDFLTISAHKIHGPKGIGALYKKKGVNIEPITFGGGQELGLRPGTENLPGIAGFNEAVKLISVDINKAKQHVTGLSNNLRKQLNKIDNVVINSPPNSSPYITNFSVKGIKSEIMLHYLESMGIFISSGSACAKNKYSHVLKAMRLNSNLIDSAIRVSFSKFNSYSDVTSLIEGVKSGIKNIHPN